MPVSVPYVLPQRRAAEPHKLNRNFRELQDWVRTNVVHADGSVPFTGQVQVSNGGNDTAPGIAFSDVTDTGIAANDDTVWLVSNGSYALSAADSSIRSYVQHRFANGTVGAPGLSFAHDTDKGFYAASSDIRWAVAGTLGGLLHIGGVRTVDGSQSVPAWGFFNDTDTGVYRHSSNQMRFVAGGAWKLIVDGTNGLYLSGLGTTGSAANLNYNSSTGLVSRFTSSIRYKNEIQDADGAWIQQLRPVTFHHKGDDGHYMGFIAEEVNEVHQLAGVVDDDGNVEAYDLHAIVAGLTAEVQRLHREKADA